MSEGKKKWYGSILSLCSVKAHWLPHPPSSAENVSQRKQIPVAVFEEKTKWSLAGKQEGNGKSTEHREQAMLRHTEPSMNPRTVIETKKYKLDYSN